jgi:hypothetical protein
MMVTRDESWTLSLVELILIGPGEVIGPLLDKNFLTIFSVRPKEPAEKEHGHEFVRVVVQKYRADSQWHRLSRHCPQSHAKTTSYRY